ncbi:MAG: MarR family transcriptional regulator [Sedimentisphaerales bacterium]|nr:MarR family transcriptional regulator [Sedimentisphaerales bacterium]
MKQQRQAGFLMAKIRQVSGRIFERMLNRYGVEINSAQGRIMFALWQQDNISINELAKKTQLKKSTLTSMLDRLEGMEYVKRERSKKDRRIILIKRTSKDKNLEKKYAELSQEHAAFFYNGFSESQIDRFEKDLELILNNLTEYESKMDL